MRILYTIPWSGYGGSEQQFLNTITEFTANGHEVIVLTGMETGPLWTEYKNNSLGHIALTFSYPKFDIDLVTFSQIVDRVNPDIIHVQRPGGEGVPHHLVQYMGGIPIVYTILCDRVDDAPWADSVIHPSFFSYSLSPKYPTKFPTRAIIHHSVKRPDTWKLPGSKIVEEKVKQIKSKHKYVCGRIGTLDSTKRVQDAIECVRRYPEIALIIGGRDLYGWFRRTQFPLPYNVYYLGELSEGDKWYVLSNLHVCLYPTTQEAQGLAMIEAMLAGVPVVTYPDSANKETVSNGIGNVSEECTVESLYLALAKTLSGKWQYHNQGVFIINYYSPKNQYYALKSVYERVIHDQVLEQV